MDEDTLSALLLAHLVETLQLAISALALVDVPQKITLEQLQALESAHQSLEASTVMLLQRSGATWEEMAKQLGVTRQSLHRRLSRRSVDLERRAQDISSLEQQWKQRVKLLGQEFEEVSGMKPRWAARREAHRILDGSTKSRPVRQG